MEQHPRRETYGEACSAAKSHSRFARRGSRFQAAVFAHGTRPPCSRPRYIYVRFSSFLQPAFTLMPMQTLKVRAARLQ